MTAQSTDPTKPWAPQERLIVLLVSAILEQPNSALNLVDRLFALWTDEEQRTVAAELYQHVRARVERVAMNYTATKLPNAFSGYIDAVIQKALKDSGIEAQVRARTEEYVRLVAERRLAAPPAEVDEAVTRAVDSVLVRLGHGELKALLRDLLMRREGTQERA